MKDQRQPSQLATGAHRARTIANPLSCQSATPRSSTTIERTGKQSFFYVSMFSLAVLAWIGASLNHTCPPFATGTSMVDPKRKKSWRSQSWQHRSRVDRALTCRGRPTPADVPTQTNTASRNADHSPRQTRRQLPYVRVRFPKTPALKSGPQVKASVSPTPAAPDPPRDDRTSNSGQKDFRTSATPSQVPSISPISISVEATVTDAPSFDEKAASTEPSSLNTSVQTENYDVSTLEPTARPTVQQTSLMTDRKADEPRQPGLDALQNVETEERQPPPPSSEDRGKTNRIWTVALAGGTVACLVTVITAISRRRRRSHQHVQEAEGGTSTLMGLH